MNAIWHEFIFDGNIAFGLCACQEDLDRIGEAYKREEEKTDILTFRMWGEEGDVPTFKSDGEGMTLKDWIHALGTRCHAVDNS